MSEESSTISDKVRNFIQAKFDDSYDFETKSNRQNAIKEFKKNFPDEKQTSIDSLFSRELPKISAAYGKNPEMVKSKTKPKFSNELGITAQEKKANVPNQLAIQNPLVNPDANKNQEIKAPMPYTITDTAVSSFCDSLFKLVQVFDEDIPDLDKSEKEDLGFLWTPLAQTRINSERGLALLAAGGTAGMVARKVKQAKLKKSERKKKEEVKTPAPTPEPKTDSDDKQELMKNG